MSNFSLYRIARPFFALATKLVYNPTRINNQVIPKKGPVILAGNHKHKYDPFFVGYSTNRVVHILAKPKAYKGAIGPLIKNMGTITVDPNSDAKKSPVDLAVEYLQKGEIVNLSPEGTRNRTDEILLPFKPGAVVMAQRANVGIIPYAITGSYDNPKDIQIEFGSPLDVQNLPVEEANQLLYEEVKKLILRGKKHDTR